MATTKSNPLDSFVASSAPGTIKLPPLPNLGELISAAGFKDGHSKYHELMLERDRLIEQLLNERLQSKDAVPAGKVE